MKSAPPPILANKSPRTPAVFKPENLMREARRQRGLSDGAIPEICVLDPDGDILRHLKATDQARRSDVWACYHSDLFEFNAAGVRAGIVGCAVGAPYAVLLAEQMFVSGCRLLVSITSSGQLKPLADAPYFVLVEEALRDEGTSYHYAPPAERAHADARLIGSVQEAVAGLDVTIVPGATWTTDAPYRETQQVIDEGNRLGLAAIEMECAALYALAAARVLPIVCFAHVTNTMAVSEGDFEKGDADGAIDALKIIGAIAGGMEQILV